MSSLYFHIPFCQSACSYCDFYFLVSKQREEGFFSALEEEFSIRSCFFDFSSLKSIYFGGGTPSFANPLLIEKLLKLIFLRIEKNTPSVRSSLEITLEANPGDLDKSKLDFYRSIGINRISLGVQSFLTDDLIYLERKQSASQTEKILELLQSWNNWSLDLIYGMPTLNWQRWKENLEKALHYRAPHLSLYELTVETGTPLHHKIKNKKKLPLDEPKLVEQFKLGMATLKKSGYHHYEISNFCLENHQSIHNSHYWKGGNYYGLGPSAHSLIDNTRYKNHSNLKKYLKALQKKQLPIEWQETLTPQTRFNEYVMTSLRTDRGVDLGYTEEQFGEDRLDKLCNDSKVFFESGYLKLMSPLTPTKQNTKKSKNSRKILKLTDQGKLFCDHITAELFQD